MQQMEAAVLSALSQYSSGKNGKQSRATPKHAALKCLAPRPSVGMEHAEAPRDVTIILDGSL